MGNGCTSFKAVEVVQASSLPTLKIVIVGESAVGKSSIVERYQKNQFLSRDYEPTKIVNIVSVVKKVNIPDQGIATLELWDTPGHEDVNIRKTHYLNADAVVVVVDISDPDALDGALEWKQDFSANIRHTRPTDSHNSTPTMDQKNTAQSREQYRPKPGSVPVLLLGNKFDIAKENYLREQYTTYDMLASHVTFNPEVKTNSTQETENKNIVSTSTPKADAEKQDNDADQGIVVDASEEEVKNPPEKQENTSDEDQGIVADKEDTPSDKSAPSNNGDVPNEKQEVSENADATSATADVKESKVANPVVEEKTLNPDEKEPDSSEANVKTTKSKPKKKKKKKKSVDSGVVNNSSQSLVEPSPNPVSEQEPSDKPDEVAEEKPKKLQKIFPKDLVKQEKEQEPKAETEEPTKPDDETKKDSDEKESETIQIEESIEESPMINEGSIITTLSILPPCVDALENFAEEHGFITGIPVSAKDSKGGVHEALQSLVRHLVAKRKQSGTTRRQRIDEMSLKSQSSAGRRGQHRVRKTNGDEFEPLQEVGIIEIDETLRKCNPALRQAEELTTGYREAIHDFKRACYKQNLVEGSSISMEECVSAVKEAVQSPPKTRNEKSEIRAALLMQEYRPNFSLVAADEDNFINLNVVDGNGDLVDLEDIQETLLFSKEAHVALQIYHEKVLESCSSVLESGFELEQVLSQFCDQLSAKEEKAWDMAVAAGQSQSTVRRILVGLAQDRARLRGTLEQVKDTRRSVNAIRARIRAALLF
uniref:Uncharacterized protein LOC100180971 n=1 Tax=Phallusia mammillata TaxID=59560 RepID=A0A6F9DI38_9ASCI|nr:uncharacterized protein LOC100180971 [Phallusia mammillata]